MIWILKLFRVYFFWYVFALLSVWLKSGLQRSWCPGENNQSLSSMSELSRNLIKSVEFPFYHYTTSQHHYIVQQVTVTELWATHLKYLKWTKEHVNIMIFLVVHCHAHHTYYVTFCSTEIGRSEEHTSELQSHSEIS